MEFEQDKIAFASHQIGLIDSVERNIFLETVGTDKQIDFRIYQKAEASGVYFSCIIYGGVRIHISLNTDTDTFNEDIAAYVQSTLQKSGYSSCLIWVWNENKMLIRYIKDKFQIQPDCGVHYYASIEFIMRRKSFSRVGSNSTLEIRPYEEKDFEKYLYLLDGSMTFICPPSNYMENKDQYLKSFAEHAEKNSFEAFWKDGELIGLYWRKNAEIDIMAVADNQQRKGYGSAILTRAIEMVFKSTTEEYAYLYAVDWNRKGQEFYKKYGMEINGHSYLLRLSNYTG